MSLFLLGDVARGDVVVTAMTAQKTGAQTQTSLRPGDVVVIIKQGRDRLIVAATQDHLQHACLYGLVTHGIVGFTVPVITRGHAIAYLDSSLFSDIRIGSPLTCSHPDRCGCCPILVMQKVTARKEDGSLCTAYELKF